MVCICKIRINNWWQTLKLSISLLKVKWEVYNGHSSLLVTLRKWTHFFQHFWNEHKSELSGIRQEVLTSAKKKLAMSYSILRWHSNKSSVAVYKIKILIQFFTTFKKTKFKISDISVQQNEKRNKKLAGGFQ